MTSGATRPTAAELIAIMGEARVTDLAPMRA
jgi:hypothetical protein